MRMILLLAVLLFAGNAAARMYQWVDPDSGTTQLSGVPPAWYRSEDSGPRVFVFDRGQIVDDTGIKVPEAERARLRQQALYRAEQDREAARRKQIDALEMKAMFEVPEEAEPVPPPAEHTVPELVPEEKPADLDEEAQRIEAEMMERMRTLVEQWDQDRTRGAREVIESRPD